ncbi:MAG: alpha/beta hydrolase [Eubacteriales bacterium]|nr:alpha/beta hydrolase [Eubacteriales bacterium]
MKRYLEKITDELNIEYDIPFANVIGYDGNPIELALDVYSPANDTDTNRRTIIIVHGGGFVGGTKQQDYVKTLAIEFAQLGYVCVSIDYRLHSKDKHPGRKLGAVYAAEDVEMARLFLCDNAEKFGINMSNIALMGGSAGGMAINEACKNKDAGYRCCICLWGGPEEITEPEKYVDMLLSHGTDDHTVAYEKSVDLYNALNEVGVHCELIPIEGADHTCIHMRHIFMLRATQFLDERMN